MHKARDGENGLAVPGRWSPRISNWPPTGSSLDSVLVNFHENFMHQPWLIKSLVSSG